MYTLSYCCSLAVKICLQSISLFAPLRWKNNSYVKLCGVPPRLPVRVRLVRQSRLSNLSFVNLSAFTPNYCITINFAYQIYWSNKKRNLLHLFHTTSIFCEVPTSGLKIFRHVSKSLGGFLYHSLVRHIVLNHKYPGFVLVFVLAPGRRFHHVAVAVFWSFRCRCLMVRCNCINTVFARI